MKAKILCLFIFFAVFPRLCSAADPWPGGAGTTIATYLDASGIVWHEARQSLFVVRNSGTLVEINSSGTELHTWAVAGDLEGVTLAENDRYLYIGIENPDSIVEFDLQTEALTGKSWNLTAWMASTDPNQGLEGLAYRNGLFRAGLQEDGKIYVFNVNLAVSGAVSHVETVTPYAGHTDISGLDYNSDTGLTYAIFDSSNVLLELNSSNGTVHEYALPGTAQEGITFKTNCMSRVADAYVANDDTGSVVKYANYPVTCLDADSDGVNYATDCNDYDASISSNVTYYRDADGDGLGSDTTTSVCSLTAPAGYVTNTSDQNDNDFDNDGSPTSSDCDDNDASLSQLQTYYRDVDGDGLGDANTTTALCSLEAPGGYVSNNDDTLDIADNGSLMYINGAYHAFFPENPTAVYFTNANFYGDEYEEVIAVALTNSKNTYISVARVSGGTVIFSKRVRIKKKYKNAQIIPQIEKRKFITRFNGKKKYTWKITSSGSFKKSR